MLVPAWSDVGKTTIVNYFLKANISVNAQTIAANVESNLLKDLNADLLRENSLR